MNRVNSVSRASRYKVTLLKHKNGSLKVVIAVLMLVNVGQCFYNFKIMPSQHSVAGYQHKIDVQQQQIKALTTELKNQSSSYEKVTVSKNGRSLTPDQDQDNGQQNKQEGEVDDGQ